MLAGAVLRFCVTDAIALRLPAGEVAVQGWVLYKVTALPAILMAIPFGGMVAVQSSGLINQVGANSLIGAASGVGVVRQGAPITAGLLMGGLPQPRSRPTWAPGRYVKSLTRCA